MTHFHANIIEDDGATREANTLDAPTGPFLTREKAIERVLVEAGSIASRPSWALAEAKIDAIPGMDAFVEFHNSRSGVKMTLAAWACSCQDGERLARAESLSPSRSR